MIPTKNFVFLLWMISTKNFVSYFEAMNIKPNWEKIRFLNNCKEKDFLKNREYIHNSERDIGDRKSCHQIVDRKFCHQIGDKKSCHQYGVTKLVTGLPVTNLVTRNPVTKLVEFPQIGDENPVTKLVTRNPATKLVGFPQIGEKKSCHQIGDRISCHQFEEIGIPSFGSPHWSGDPVLFPLIGQGSQFWVPSLGRGPSSGSPNWPGDPVLGPLFR